MKLVKSTLIRDLAIGEVPKKPWQKMVTLNHRCFSLLKWYVRIIAQR